MPISITNQSPYDRFSYFPISNMFSSLWGNIGKYDRDTNEATCCEFFLNMNVFFKTLAFNTYVTIGLPPTLNYDFQKRVLK